jgi:hypothetical protein
VIGCHLTRYRVTAAILVFSVIGLGLIVYARVA